MNSLLVTFKLPKVNIRNVSEYKLIWKLAKIVHIIKNSRMIITKLQFNNSFFIL